MGRKLVRASQTCAAPGARQIDYVRFEHTFSSHSQPVPDYWSLSILPKLIEMKSSLFWPTLKLRFHPEVARRKKLNFISNKLPQIRHEKFRPFSHLASQRQFSAHKIIIQSSLSTLKAPPRVKVPNNSNNFYKCLQNPERHLARRRCKVHKDLNCHLAPSLCKGHPEYFNIGHHHCLVFSPAYSLNVSRNVSCFVSYVNGNLDSVSMICIFFVLLVDSTLRAG